MTINPSSSTLTRNQARTRPQGAEQTTSAVRVANPSQGQGAQRPERNSPGPGIDRPGDGAPSEGSRHGGGSGALPLAVDSFLGRDHDLRGIDELFDRGRLVTVTGAPGMGKTRLATEVARASVERYQNGVWVVALAPLTDPKLVAPALATALGVPDQAGADIVVALAARLGSNHLLLVLDNCEHLLDACAQLAGSLVESCPNLKILATSQERLGITGEQVWPLSGLAVPDEADRDLDEAAALTFSAVALFVERARAISPGFEIDTTNFASVVVICRRLDGIPLAIELAAAWVKVLRPAEIAANLDNRFTFLTSGSRKAQPRHQTLQAAVDWSYDLLGQSEQTVLRRLSVFAGGARLDAVETVCGDGLGVDDCLPILHTLVERSLVVTTADGDGQTRFGLLETIRFYGHDRLVEAGEASTTAARHGRWCVALAEEAEPQLTGPVQTQWVARLGSEHDNLRAAMAWSLEQGPTETALNIAAALAMFWRITGHFGEGLGWLDRALDVSEGSGAPLRAKALWGKSLMAAMVGDWTTAIVSGRDSLALYEEHNDAGGAGRALLVLAGAPIVGRALSDGLAAFQRAIALARHADDRWCLARGLAQCGFGLAQAGDTRAARPMLEESIAVARASGDGAGFRFGLISLGRVALMQGDLPVAEGSFQEALSGSRQDGDAYEMAWSCTGLADVAIIRGEMGAARQLLAEAQEHTRAVPSEHSFQLTGARIRLALAEGDLDSAERELANQHDATVSGALTPTPSALLDAGELAVARGAGQEALPMLTHAMEKARATHYPAIVARALELLGHAARQQGERERSTMFHRQAFEARLEIGDRPGVVASLEALAGLATRAGRTEPAAFAFASAEAARAQHSYARTGRARDYYDADLALSKAALAPEAFAAAWAEGTQMSIEAAVGQLFRKREAAGNRPAGGVAALTEAERRVVELVLNRLTNAEIAEQLFLSVNTVKSHLTRAFPKLAVSSRAELFKRFPEGSL